MGWCHEFGPQIRDGCEHPMAAGQSACTCLECGAVCAGRFNGCASVWERGVDVTSAGTVRAAPKRGRRRKRWSETLPAIEPTAPVPVAAASAPAPKPSPVPAPVAASPTAAPQPQPQPQVPRPRPRPAPAAAVDPLDALKARIDGLRGQVKALGDSIRTSDSG